MSINLQPNSHDQHQSSSGEIERRLGEVKGQLKAWKWIGTAGLGLLLSVLGFFFNHLMDARDKRLDTRFRSIEFRLEALEAAHQPVSQVADLPEVRERR